MLTAKHFDEASIYRAASAFEGRRLDGGSPVVSSTERIGTAPRSLAAPIRSGSITPGLAPRPGADRLHDLRGRRNPPELEGEILQHRRVQIRHVARTRASEMMVVRVSRALSFPARFPRRRSGSQCRSPAPTPHGGPSEGRIKGGVVEGAVARTCRRRDRRAGKDLVDDVRAVEFLADAST